MRITPFERVRMPDFTNSVMVALLPTTTEWSKTALPHLTLVYAGEKSELKPTDFNELCKDAASIAMVNHPIQLMVDAPDIFGEQPERVDVLKLKPTHELMRMRQRLIHWNASTWPFTPHVTIGPVGSLELLGENIPPAIAFDRLLVSWGIEQITFWLKP